MRKILLIISIFLLFLSGCSEQDNPSPEFIGTGVHQEFLEKGVITSTSDYYYTFDSQKNIAVIEEYMDGILSYRSYLEYDEFGNTTQVKTEKDSIVTTYDYQSTLDEKGRILRQEVMNGDKLVSLEEHTYDKQNNEIHRRNTTWYDESLEPQWEEYTMTYDRKGIITRKEQHRSYDTEYTVWEYENGLCVFQFSYLMETNQLTEKIGYTYDSKGNKTSAITYNPVTDKITKNWEFTYDAENRCIRECRYGKSDQLELYHEYIYDDTVHTKTKNTYSADGIMDTDYDIHTFDEYGNEILREMYRDGEVYWRIRYDYKLIEAVK